MPTNPEQYRICLVAGHHFVDKSDSYGSWRECERCGQLASKKDTGSGHQ